MSRNEREAYKHLEHSGERYWHQLPPSRISLKPSPWRMTNRAWWLATALVILIILGLLPGCTPARADDIEAFATDHSYLLITNQGLTVVGERGESQYTIACRVMADAYNNDMRTPGHATCLQRWSVRNK